MRFHYGQSPNDTSVQRVSARRIFGTNHLSIKWHLLMDSPQHTLTTNVTGVIARILCDYQPHVKPGRKYSIKEPGIRLYDVSYWDNLANETYVHLESAETIS